MFKKKENSSSSAPKVSSETNPAVKVLKRWRVSIALVVVMIIVLRVCFGIVQSQNTKYAEAQAQLASLQNQQKMNQITGSKKASSAKKELSGLDTARKNADDDIAEKFFESCLDWHDYKSYNEKRQWVIDQKDASEHSVNVDNKFLTVFFPEVTESQAADGTKSNMIDADGLNADFDDSSFKSYVTDIDSTGNVYSYLAEFDITSDTKYDDSDGKSHSATGSAKIAVTYDVDSNGNMNNVMAYTITE